MTCEMLRNRLDAYIDGSCPAEELEQTEYHLRTCSSCAFEALHRTQLKRATKAAAIERFVPSAEFRARMAKSLHTTRKPLFAGPWIPSLSLAAALVVALIVSALWVEHVQRQQAMAELLDLHVATLASVNPVDVISTDRHTVKPWFQGKLPFSFNLPELEDSPFRLAGGKLVYFDHAPGAQLVYLFGKHEISVFILQDDRAIASAGALPASARKNGFNFESETTSGLRFVLVSDTNLADVHQLADLLKAAQQP
jgi:anti-sigma factor RsiW